MKILNSVLWVLALTAALGCSNHYRTGDAGLSSSEVQTLLQDVEGAQSSGTGTGDLATALSYKNQPNTLVYVAVAPIGKLKVANVVSFRDFSFLGAPNSETMGFESIAEARVIFIDTSAHESALIIGIKMVGQEQFAYYTFIGQGEISDGSFTAKLSGGSGGEIGVQSFDIEDGDLGTTIQLKVYNSNGDYVGKVATMSGFAL